MEKYDCAIIGGGPGGYVCAIRLARFGKKVIVIEKEKIGGVCLNRGCIPTKTLLSATEIAMKEKYFNRVGIKVSIENFNLDKLRSFKNQVVNKLVKGVEYLFRKHNIDLLSGTAKLLEPGRIAIGGEEIFAQQIIIATGTIPLELPSLPFDNRRILSSDDLLEITSVPKQLLIVGAGAVGLEIGLIYHNLGSKVTIIEMMETILPGSDREMTELLKNIIEKFGIKIVLKTKIEDYPDINKFDLLLVAAGRKPVLPECNFEMELDNKGHIIVDKSLKTNVPNIYAIGDITGTPYLAHRASHQGIKVAEIIAGEEPVEIDPIPTCVYTHPEYASVGVNEDEIDDPLVGRFPIAASGRAASMGCRDGQCKVIIDRLNHQIKGAHILSPIASELISSMTLAIKSHITAEQFERVIHPHPTLSEILPESLSSAFHRAIHIY